MEDVSVKTNEHNSSIVHTNDQTSNSQPSYKTQSTSQSSPNASMSRSKHIILTGSTGSLGAYLLHELLADSSVTKITCLNRSDDAQERQVASHTTRGLVTTFCPSRVDFWTCDLAKPELGLESQQYQLLLDSVTHIIHNAWSVDFNRHFSTFEPHIQGVKNLIDLARGCSPRPVRLFFMSSVSVAGRWGAVPGVSAQVPETVLEDWRLAKMGYGQSKLVAERLVAEAATQHGVDAAIGRIGQIGGPVLRNTQGEWNRREWVPSLILSSKTMSIFPATLGPMETVDWLPADIVAQVCLELLFETGGNQPRAPNGTEQSEKNRAQVWHVVNPRHTKWSSLLPSIIQSVNSEAKTVEFGEWVEELQRRSDHAQKNDTVLDDPPAAKLLSFFEDLRDKAGGSQRITSATVETTETLKHSKTMVEVSAVNKEWVELWVNQWRL